MVRAILAITAALVMTALPAESKITAWKMSTDRITVPPAGISLPKQAGNIAFVKASEASSPGEAIDNVAQFESADGAVFATAYIFYATYADTALVALGTDAAIHERFGPAVVLTSETVVPVGGTPAAIRRVYEHGSLEAGKPLISTAAFVRAGRWMVAIRASGPEARRGEIETALDTLIAGLRFNGSDQPMEAAVFKISGRCSPALNAPARTMPAGADANAATLIAAMMGGAIVPKTEGKAKPDQFIAFPHNGTVTACTDGTIEGRPILRAGSGPSDLSLFVINDAGGILVAEPQLMGKGVTVKRYGIATVDVLGSFETTPDVAQLAAILNGGDKQGASVRSRTTYTANGKSNVSVNADLFK